MGVCNCSMLYCTLPYVQSSIAIILIRKGELVALLNLSSWCLVMVERLFLAVLWGCLRFVIVAFPDHTPLLFFILLSKKTYTLVIFWDILANVLTNRITRLLVKIMQLLYVPLSNSLPVMGFQTTLPPPSTPLPPLNKNSKMKAVIMALAPL